MGRRHISEHGRANALDVSAYKLANGGAIGLTGQRRQIIAREVTAECVFSFFDRAR